MNTYKFENLKDKINNFTNIMKESLLIKKKLKKDNFIYDNNKTKKSNYYKLL